MPLLMVRSPCPLCSGNSEPFHDDPGRAFYRCPDCDLIFVANEHLPPLKDELARYALHDNRFDDPDYRAFLSRLAGPIIARTSLGAHGLDYGCGQAPVLADILSASGRPTASYDPHFRRDSALLSRRYDFLTCSEVVEHVHDPLPMFELFARLMDRGGVIGVMTGLSDDAGPFADWWYRRDPTHVRFYSRATMGWVASRFGWSVEFPGGNVTVYTARASRDKV